MDQLQIDALLREDLFPGNGQAFKLLTEQITNGRVTAFIGAGASVPLVPTWLQALKELTDQARDSGKIDFNDHNYLSEKLMGYPLEVADELEGVIGSAQFRAEIGKLFRPPNGVVTDCGNVLLKLPLDSIITTNYDCCLTTAYILNRRLKPDVYVSDTREHLVNWRNAHLGQQVNTPILHLHGVYERPRSMIFTGRDYDKFYLEGRNHQFLEEVWKNQRLLVVGFSFSDPFLRIFASSSVSNLDVESRHFAFIGYLKDTQISLLQRKNFESKYRLRPIFYKVEMSNGVEDHSALISCLLALASKIQRIESGMPANGNATLEHSSLPSAGPSQTLSQKLRDEFERSLLARGDRTLYVSPRIMNAPREHDEQQNEKAQEIAIEEIVRSDESYVIHTTAECGGTTLAKRLAYEISLRRGDVVIKDATTMPSYRSKLIKEFPGLQSGSRKGVIIVDNCNISRHDRLLKELTRLEISQRLIVIARSNHFEFSSLDNSKDVSVLQEFKHAYLWPLTRADIRVLATQLIDTSDDDLITEAVNKVYKDLLSLCIPLTPANVLMYLQVLGGEQNFDPLNRVQIVDRYIAGLLRSPREIFSSTFSARSKVELISGFAYHLYDTKAGSFTLLDWLKFTKDYKERNLLEFDDRRILDEFIETRIIVESGSQFFFKYRFFYSFFICKHIYSRPELLDSFIEDEKYLSLYCAVEVLSSLASDNTKLVSRLCQNLESLLSQFGEQYLPEDFDPFGILQWAPDEKEIDDVWRPVTKLIERGPVPHSEIDKVKSCLLSEVATEDQRISFRRFDELERRLVAYHACVRQTLISSDDLEGQLKVRAARALLRSYFVFFQVAFCLTPVLMKVTYFNWFGLLFVNPRRHADGEPSPVEQMHFAMNWIPSVAHRVREMVATKKLGPVFRKLVQDKGNKGFPKYLALQCLIRSKPAGWSDEVEKIINEAPRNSYSLYELLTGLLLELQTEVNAIGDQSEIKSLIARVKTKRDFSRERPTAKAVKRTLALLNKKRIFDAKSENLGPSDQKNA
jgi:hypothetical protein